MKTAKTFDTVHRLSFVPEVGWCPHCRHRLQRAHPVWRKHILTLREVLYVVSMGYACPNRACPHPRVIYRSAAAEALSLPYFSYGLDVLAQIGALRLNEHCTRQEIHRRLQEGGLSTPVHK